MIDYLAICYYFVYERSTDNMFVCECKPILKILLGGLSYFSFYFVTQTNLCHVTDVKFKTWDLPRITRRQKLTFCTKMVLLHFYI